MSHNFSSLNKFMEEYSLFNAGLNINFIGTVTGRYDSAKENMSIEPHSLEYMKVTGEIIQLLDKAESLAKRWEEISR